jgi:hypothetical protein
MPGPGAVALPLRRLRGEPGAQIRLAQLLQRNERGLFAEMPGQEAEEIGDVVRIGFDRVRRGAPFAGKPVEKVK